MVSGGGYILLKLLLQPQATFTYLTTHLWSLPPASSAGPDVHEYLLPADPITLKPKETKSCAGEIKRERDLLLIILDGSYRQKSLSCTEKSLSYIRASTRSKIPPTPLAVL